MLIGATDNKSETAFNPFSGLGPGQTISSISLSVYNPPQQFHRPKTAVVDRFHGLKVI